MSAINAFFDELLWAVHERIKQLSEFGDHACATISDFVEIISQLNLCSMSGVYTVPLISASYVTDVFRVLTNESQKAAFALAMAGFFRGASENTPLKGLRCAWNTNVSVDRFASVYLEYHRTPGVCMHVSAAKMTFGNR
jgi:hypothetical protein